MNTQIFNLRKSKYQEHRLYRFLKTWDSKLISGSFDNTLDINTKNSVEKCLNRYRNFQNLISRGSIRASFDKNVEELKSRFNQVRWFDQETRLWWSDGEGEGREKEWISSKFSTLLSVKSSYPQDPSPQETVHAKLLAQSGF